MLMNLINMNVKNAKTTKRDSSRCSGSSFAFASLHVLLAFLPALRRDLSQFHDLAV